MWRSAAAARRLERHGSAAATLILAATAATAVARVQKRQPEEDSEGLLSDLQCEVQCQGEQGEQQQQQRRGLRRRRSPPHLQQRQQQHEGKPLFRGWRRHGHGASVSASEEREMEEAWCGRSVLRLKRQLQQRHVAHCHEDADGEGDSSEEVENWSSTHKVTTKALLRPESTEEVERIIEEANKTGNSIRVLGNAISPNGLGLSEDTMLTMSLCDRVLHVHPLSMTARVEAGARVEQVVQELAKYNLTLQNYASISEQQIGGFLQVGAHGTGADIPPVDEQIISMKVVTPGLGTIELGREENPALFRLVKVGLGAFGVVTEVTLQCVPRHRLVETTTVMSRDEVLVRHSALLLNNRHVRYMWIPYTDSVVVVTCNPIGTSAALIRRATTRPPEGVVTCSTEDTPNEKKQWSEAERVEPMVQLLAAAMVGGKKGSSSKGAAVAGAGASEEEVRAIREKGASFAELRDQLLLVDPLNKEWVKQVNQAEAEFWKRSQGQRVDFSDKVLGFECGGQQWVNEVAFPTGTLSAPSGADLAFMRELLGLIEAHSVPAPAPIEQRWTASSSARMSPAHGEKGEVHSWVGIIHYLPTDDPEIRKAITSSFFKYRDLCVNHLWGKYGVAEHWAKVEKPLCAADASTLQQRLRKRYPVDEFNEVRGLMDPKNIMATSHLDAMFGTGEYSSKEEAAAKKRE